MTEIKTKTSGTVLRTPELEEFLTQKLLRLQKRIGEEPTGLIEVELHGHSHKTDISYRAEINFSSNGKVLRAEAAADTLHGAIDKVVDEAVLRLRHLKTKHVSVARKEGGKIKDFLKNFGL
jgi:ribosomal subunit interface protein